MLEPPACSFLLFLLLHDEWIWNTGLTMMTLRVGSIAVVLFDFCIGRSFPFFLLSYQRCYWKEVTYHIKRFQETGHLLVFFWGHSLVYPIDVVIIGPGLLIFLLGKFLEGLFPIQHKTRYKTATNQNVQSTYDLFFGTLLMPENGNGNCLLILGFIFPQVCLISSSFSCAWICPTVGMCPCEIWWWFILLYWRALSSTF